MLIGSRGPETLNYWDYQWMGRINRQLQMNRLTLRDNRLTLRDNRLTLRDNRLELKASGKMPILLEETR
jgi:hypothetical protein